MTYIFYNPLSCNGTGEALAKALAERLSAQSPELLNITETDPAAFVRPLTADDTVIICGGDGTLNNLANSLADEDAAAQLYLFPCGTGNDFYNDLPESERTPEGLVPLNKYLRDLPVVEVNGMTRRFINGIGFGIDGMACEVADKQRAAGKTDINYASISIGLLIHGYRRATATVTVDGKTQVFNKVWLAASMKGRKYGGGMIMAPGQDRLSDQLTLVVAHDLSKLRTLMIFPTIFKGEHVKNTNKVACLKGREITVRFDRPCALQIDGETVLGVTEYTARLG